MDGNCFSEKVNTIYTSMTIPRERGCFGYAFINKGDTGVRINQTYLKPYPAGRPELSGESYAYVDPCRVPFNMDFQITFDQLPGVVPAVEIHQYYDLTVL